MTQILNNVSIHLYPHLVLLILAVKQLKLREIEIAPLLCLCLVSQTLLSILMLFHI